MRAITPRIRVTPPKTSPSMTRKSPTPAKIGANDGPGIWMPAGVRRVRGCFPRLAGGAFASRRKIRMRTTTTKSAIPTGMSETRTPQSGVTTCAINSRMLVQSRSSIVRSGQGSWPGRSESLVHGAGDEHVGHQRHRRTEDDQHRRPGVVDGPSAEVGDGPIDHPGDDE